MALFEDRLRRKRYPFDDAYTYDPVNQQWTSQVAQIDDNQPRSAAGFSAGPDKVYFYGGSGNAGELDGLFVLHLGTLTGMRLDVASGGRAQEGVSLSYDPLTRRVYLFGGKQGTQQFNDLWRFSLDDLTWTQITDGTEPKAPRAMDGGAIVVSPVDGAVSILAGRVESSAGQPLWRHTHQGWQTYNEILGFEE